MKNGSKKNESLYLLGYGTLTDNMYRKKLMTGLRNYELTNHLGNVLTVISDMVIPHDDDSDGTVDWYLADTLQATDYSPFGVTLHNRNLTKTGAEKFRFGFNDMEADDEVKGDGNSYDFGARMLDSRIGRWLTIDPLFRKYPDLSPYNFAGNSPLLFIDPNGKEIIIHYMENGVDKTYNYTPGLKPTVSNQFVQQVHEAISYVMKNDDDKVFQTIDNDLSKVHIRESSIFNDKANQTSYNQEGNPAQSNSQTGKVIESTVEATITWKPLAMLQTTSGGGMAPSTILLHEADHARGYLAISTLAEYQAWVASKTNLDPSSPDFAYDNLEEKRVITGSEAKYIRKINSKSHDKWTKFGSYEYTSGKSGKRVRATWWRTDYAQRQTVRYDHSGLGIFRATGVNSISRADGRPVSGQASTYGRFIKKIINKAQ